MLKYYKMQNTTKQIINYFEIREHLVALLLLCGINDEDFMHKYVIMCLHLHDVKEARLQQSHPISHTDQIKGPLVHYLINCKKTF